MSKPVRFSRHALERATLRGATDAEVLEAVRACEKEPAKHGRQGYRRTWAHAGLWGGRAYNSKQVLAIVADEADALVVVTVYTFYF